MIVENPLASVILSVVAAGLLGLAYSFWQSYKINKLESVNPKISETAASIKKGVVTYLTAEYKFLALFAISLGILLFFYGKSQENSNGLIAAALIIGAVSSALAGYFSMRISTTANTKITSETQKSYSNGFLSAFSAGTSIGIIGASSVVLGISILLIAMSLLKLQLDMNTLLNIISGFVLGATTVSIFARLGGSLFSKGADIAEIETVDIEAGVSEKSPHNPASVANESGQTISNVGGIGSDIFESLTAAIVATMMIGAGMLSLENEPKSFGVIILPLVIAAIGILASGAGSFLLRSSEVSTSRKAINIAEGFAAIILAIAAYFATKYLLPVKWEVSKATDTEIIYTTYKSFGIFWSAFFGIAASVGIGYITEFYTNKESQTVKNIVNKSSKGAANNILGGIESGLISTGIPTAVILAVAIASYYFAGFYGLGLAAVGFLGNSGLQLAFNAFAPIADNSNSIAIKAELEEETIKQTNHLKTTGIQSIAQGKVFLALASSLTTLALLGAFISVAGINGIDIKNPLVLGSLIVGALLPMLLSSNALGAVNRLSKKIVNEVQRQFIEIPQLAEAKEILDKYNGDLTYATTGEKEIVYSAQDSAEYNQCIEIATYATIWETLIPGIIAITIPVLLAYFGSAEMLASLLIGTITVGTLMSIYQANTGSALENAKYALEEGVVINGEMLGTNSPAYQSTIVGNKFAKPVKDAASPAMTVMMKIMLITAIVLIPLVVNKMKKKSALHVNNELIINNHSNNYITQNTIYRF